MSSQNALIYAYEVTERSQTERSGTFYAYELTAISQQQRSGAFYAYEQTSQAQLQQSGYFYSFEATSLSTASSPQDGRFYAMENTIDQANPTQIRVWDGGQWVVKPIYQWDGSSWQEVS